jgi:hypothetical protein
MKNCSLERILKPSTNSRSKMPSKESTESVQFPFAGLIVDNKIIYLKNETNFDNCND